MITQPQFALGSDGQLSLWCKSDGVTKEGHQKFFAINGYWNGTFDGSQVYVDRTEKVYPAEILWQGKAPFAESEYNEAMEWIRGQISNGASGSDTAIHGSLSGVPT